MEQAIFLLFQSCMNQSFEISQIMDLKKENPGENKIFFFQKIMVQIPEKQLKKNYV